MFHDTSPRRFTTINKNVKSSEIFSKAWCDLVFQGRNTEYGAYRIRQRAGRRMRFAVMVVWIVVLAVVIVPIGFQLFVRYKMLMALQDAGKEVKELKRLEDEREYEVKRVSAGRAAPTVTTIKGASNEAPDIVEVQQRDIIFALGGDETFIAESEPTFEDLDSLHNRERADLPIEGAQLVKVEQIDALPEYPGGMMALMDYLDSAVVYSNACVAAKVEGDLEVKFFIDAEGRVAEPKFTKKLHPDIERSVMRALMRMPRWRPGRQYGRVSAVSVTLPMHFQLR